MFSGAVAGGIAGGLTTPLDVIKTYLQTQTRKPRPTTFLTITTPDKGHVTYSGVYSALRGVYKTSGISGLFSGVGVRMVWTSSQSCAMFFLYEFMMDNVQLH